MFDPFSGFNPLEKALIWVAVLVYILLMPIMIPLQWVKELFGGERDV